jgi:hypothetical protein
VSEPTIAEDEPAPVIRGATDDSASQAREEFDRERRLVDQMLSMQARLRDWYRGGATFMTCTILGASTVGIAFAFAGNDGSVDVIGVQADRTTWLGWLAVATFVVTLIDLVLDLRGAARQRQDAVDQLGDLKAGYYAPIDPTEEPLALQRLSERYRATMGAIPGIPERHFNRLKAKHLRKVEISRLLSKQPGISARQAAATLRKQHAP